VKNWIGISLFLCIPFSIFAMEPKKKAHIFGVTGQIEIEWVRLGVDEVGVDKESKKNLVEIDHRYFRPPEVDFLLSDTTKAKEKLGWSPKTSFNALIKLMVKAELNEALYESNFLLEDWGRNL
jgi:GDP-D-mannose dehydratase